MQLLFKKDHLILLVVILIGVLIYFYIRSNPAHSNSSISSLSFTEHDKHLANPLMGFAPSADNMIIQNDNTLVYVNLTWRDWEPEKGQYNIEGLNLKYHLETWRDSGKRVVLRFVCDIPGSESHMDIPDWLYENTDKDGTLYNNIYGKGYSPNYANKYFIKRHQMAIEALGQYYGQDSFIAYVAIGSIGHWGEWHVNSGDGLAPIPDELTCSKYIQPYLSSFPNARFLMRRPFSWVAKYQMGVYNDMAGDSKSTLEWLNWIDNGGVYTQPLISWDLTAVPDIWKEGPVGGEFTSSISMEAMLGEDINTTLGLLEKSHMTYIGPQIPQSELLTSQAQDNINKVLKSIGYRYIITESTVKLSESGLLAVTLNWKNTGAAPMYWDWPVCLYVLDENDTIQYKQQVDLALSSLQPDATLSTKTIINSKSLVQGNSKIGVGIEDPQTGEPAVDFAMQCESIDKIFIIGYY